MLFSYFTLYTTKTNLILFCLLLPSRVEKIGKVKKMNKYFTLVGWCCFSSLLIPPSLSVTRPPSIEICPPPEAYAPCYCGYTSLEPNAIALTCDSFNLTDSEVSDILDTFLSTPDISPLVLLSLRNNQLTRVPSQMQLFTELQVIDLENNAITSVESGTFKFNADYLSLSLENNQLTTIAPDSFIG